MMYSLSIFILSHVIVINYQEICFKTVFLNVLISIYHFKIPFCINVFCCINVDFVSRFDVQSNYEAISLTLYFYVFIVNDHLQHYKHIGTQYT